MPRATSISWWSWSSVEACSTVGLLMDLQEHLHCKVDVMTPAMLKSRVRERVLREAGTLLRGARGCNTTSVEGEGRTRPGPVALRRDFAKWIERQVKLRRKGSPALDVPNLIEELEGLTKRDERALGSQLKRIMAHMLKQRFQPQRASRSWEDMIANGREEIADILEQSPSLRRTLLGLMTKNSRAPYRRRAGIRACPFTTSLRSRHSPWRRSSLRRHRPTDRSRRLPGR